MREEQTVNRLTIKAGELLSAWKGEDYIFGRGVLPEIGRLAAPYGGKALLSANAGSLKPAADRIAAALAGAGISCAGLVPGARPNSPREDVYRIKSQILLYKPDLVVALGGGSTIDACKAALVLAALEGAEIEPYFGTGLVSEALRRGGRALTPLIAVQCSAGSGAHLTKYSNVTDPAAGQKKLIVDDAIIPPKALFDYELSRSMPAGVTVDGALDGIAHCFEVFAGVSPEKYDRAAALTECALELIVEYTPRVIRNPADSEGREAIGMATDLGAYAIMIGGTGGAHLTSFSLVDLTSHGTACGVMNPYYAVFFSPRIEKQLRLVGGIFKKHGYIPENLDGLSGRELGTAVARGMTAFGKAIGAPTTLGELPGFHQGYIDKALEAAKNPQLEMKLKNMPVPLTASLVDEYMGPVLRAAASGDFSLIKLMP
jgi:alcohol dehydrogenase class IV